MIREYMYVCNSWIDSQNRFQKFRRKATYFEEIDKYVGQRFNDSFVTVYSCFLLQSCFLRNKFLFRGTHRYSHAGTTPFTTGTTRSRVI